MKYPEEWKYVPIIKMKNAELCHLLNLEECSYSRLVDLLDGEHDRLSELLQFARQSMDKFSLLEKAILETDEKVALIDTVEAGFEEEFLANVHEAIGERAIDYLVVNHMEPS